MLTDTPLCVADVLERAADLIEPEGMWSQGELREYKRNGDLACACAAGAIYEAAGDDNEELGEAARDALARSLGYRSDEGAYGPHRLPPVPAWNDAPERTQPEVVAALRRAATLARAEVQA